MFCCVSKFGKTRPTVVLLDELVEMPRIRRALGLAELPTRSTLYNALPRLDMVV